VLRCKISIVPSLNEGVNFISFVSRIINVCIVANSIGLHVRKNAASYGSDNNIPYAIALGLGSIAVSTFWIAVHLNFFQKLGMHEGGWLELFSSFFLIFVWIVGLGVFTTYGGIAAKVEGDECKSNLSTSVGDSGTNCTIILFMEDSEGSIRKHIESCAPLEERVPGSNLYYACWSCMLSSIAIAFKWKASQALRFANAQAERQQRNERETGDGFAGEDGEDNLNR